MIQEHVQVRTDTHGCVYLGVVISGERHFIALHEAESLSSALRQKISDLRKCG